MNSFKFARVAAFAAALGFVGFASAADPVAVWDGDFTTMTQGTYTLSENGNTKTDTYLQISSDQGILLTSSEALNVFTVIVRCEGLNLSSANNQVLFTASETSPNTRGNLVGVHLPANNAACRGIWNGADWSPTSATIGYAQFVQNQVPVNYTTLIYNHQQTYGNYAYALGPTSDVDDSVLCTTLYSIVGLRSSGSTYNGCAIGGLRGTTSSSFLSATGLKIKSLALFSGTLSEAEMKSYAFPSEIKTIAVSSSTTVSALNSQISGLGADVKKVIFAVSPGKTITLDEEFSSSVSVAVVSEGTVKLSADSQPDASYFNGVDFLGVKGALLRSWLTPGVVGFNFNSNAGTDTSSALVGDCTWASDASSNSGSSTALFNDGLSTLTWSSETVYSYGGTSFITGYLDDGANLGNGAEVHLSCVPYDLYDVIIYASSDSGSGTLRAKTVNGKTYTWDSDAEETVEGDSAWGQTAQTDVAFGTNALRINNLTGALTIYGLTRSDSVRGGISAIQIIPSESVCTLELTGTATTWSAGTWKKGDTTLDEAPVLGVVKILATASTDLTVDVPVSLDHLNVFGGDNVVINVKKGESGSLYSADVTLEGGVFQQGSASVLGATPTILVEDGATFDVNGYSVAQPSAFRLAGAGAGSWPWSLTSSRADSPTVLLPTIIGNTTIGGDYKIMIGVSGAAGPMPLNGFTLTKTGSGELSGWNVRPTGGGTIDIEQGMFSLNQWTSLDGSETIDRHTTIIVREGASLKNNAGRRLWIDTLKVFGGTVSGNFFAVSAAFYGACSTTKLEFNTGATVTLTGDMAVDTLICGALTISCDEGTSSANVSFGSLTATGAVTVDEGISLTLSETSGEYPLTVPDNSSLTLPEGAKLSGGLILGGRLYLTLSDDDALYLPVAASLTCEESSSVYLNGSPINTSKWKWDAESGCYVNNSVQSLFYTATADFNFSDAPWTDAFGDVVEPSWNTKIEELKVTASGASAVDASVDVEAKDVATFTVAGPGDISFTGTGSIAAGTYDFSESTGRAVYDLPTGDKPVVAGSDTVLSRNGTGVPTVAAGKKLTLGPWGETGDAITYTYASTFSPEAGSTLIFNPGEGKIQKSGGFSNSNASTVIGITNGTLVVDKAGGGDSVFFGANAVQIDDGGILSLEAQDALGYSNARNVTINKGGLLKVKVRDTLKRTINFNGGKIEVEGANSNRGLDLYGNIFNVNDDSEIEQLEERSIFYLRNYNTVVNIADGKVLEVNANMVDNGGGTLTVQGVSGAVNQNGRFVLNGFKDSQLQTFAGNTTVGAASRAVMFELNCEHQNGLYTVNAASRLLGTGSITGTGGVVLSAANSRINGSLSINNVTAPNGGSFGDVYTPVSAKVVDSLTAAGTLTVVNGSATIESGCQVTNSVGTVDTTDASFKIEGDGNLILGKSLSAAGLQVADGGKITIKSIGEPALRIADEGEVSIPGKMNFIIDFEFDTGYGITKVPLLQSSNLPEDLSKFEIADSRNRRIWDPVLEEDMLWASAKRGFSLKIK